MKTEDINGYEGLYFARDDGKIFAYPKKTRKEIREVKASPHRKYSSYLRVSLYKDGKTKSHFVHRLIAESFIINSGDKPCVNHIDCNRHNNDASNLEWCTHQENSDHAGNKGRNFIKITNEMREEAIRRSINGESIHSIAKSFDVNESSVRMHLRKHPDYKLGYIIIKQKGE